ncbi:MAG: methanethiol S-methyltransferase [Hyphomicrobium sp.]
MRRLFVLLYGTACYAFFFATFLYAIGFVTGLAVPKTIDSGTEASTVTAITINVLLMSLFAMQHSVMARKQFKEWWGQFVPKEVERSTYVLFSTLALALLCWQWKPITLVVWKVTNPALAGALTALSLGGWLLVLASTFLINHFELFGLQQVFTHFRAKPMPQANFRTPLFYRVVRHPLYLGFIVAFWATPKMTAGHLLFAAVTTAYILIAIQLEERDLIQLFGEEYRRYRARVPMLLPRLGQRGDASAPLQSEPERSPTPAE